MAVKVKYRTIILKLVSGAMLLCTIAGCAGDLVYRPEKKPKQGTPVVTSTKSNLPPMPDIKANDATLAGIDTTGKGIRDDVHIWIYANYTTTVKRTILMTMAKTLQGVLVTPPKTKEDAKNLEQSFKDASMMLKIIRGIKPGETETMDTLLYEQVFNTPERLKAYLNYNLLLAGDKK